METKECIEIWETKDNVGIKLIAFLVEGQPLILAQNYMLQRYPRSEVEKRLQGLKEIK